MNIIPFRFTILGALSIVAAFSLLYALVKHQSNSTIHQPAQKAIKRSPNPVAYFEIPVLDMERAVRSYANVFDTDFTRETIDGNEMALFPIDKAGSGVSGALAKGEIYKPSTSGTLVYFLTQNIDTTLKRVQELGCKILYPKTSVGGNGFVAEFQDTEGNRIALISNK